MKNQKINLITKLVGWILLIILLLFLIGIGLPFIFNIISSWLGVLSAFLITLISIWIFLWIVSRMEKTVDKINQL